MKLSELKTGETAIIEKVLGSGQFRKRLLEMGFIQGKEVTVIQKAPLRDPIHYKILDYSVSLRVKDSELIIVKKIDAVVCDNVESELSQNNFTPDLKPYHKYINQDKPKNKIKIALVGNPNCGKTSLFNQASGAHEHVGNYSGVTVEAKTGHIVYKNYFIEIVDLPGTYSLSAYSPDELYIRNELMGDKKPDIVVNVVDVTNLERNLFLSLQIKEMGLPMVMALNMYDEFSKKEEFLDYPKLSKLLGIPMVPTVCRTGLGVSALLETVVSLWDAIQSSDSRYLDDDSGIIRPLYINYGSILEPEIREFSEKISQYLEISDKIHSRYLAVKLIEGDKYIEHHLINNYAKGAFIVSSKNFLIKKVLDKLPETDTETIIADQRYGFISGALKETYRHNRNYKKTLTDKIDNILTNRILGLPIFLLFMFVVFESTFKIGKIPQDWIQNLVDYFGEFIGSIMPDGPLKDLIIDGVIGGVGGVIVFLPQIIILYFFISLMEDSGYMARAAFLMDKVMHTMGLHGKSFISLIMGFGCNVPAIMSTRTIESRKSRIVTMLVIPFMSCSARLPVYLLFVGTLFPNNSSIILFSLYIIGILIAILSARLLQAVYFKTEDVPFVMELPPYRRPTAKSLVIHMWNKSKQYLKKMGTIILFASIVIWFLGYFPQNEEIEMKTNNQITQIVNNKDISKEEKEIQINKIKCDANKANKEQSYIGRLGKFCEPVIRPLGFDWKMGVSLLSGLVAKEVVVSTMGILYTGENNTDENSADLKNSILTEKNSNGTQAITGLTAFCFMLFVLIYFPCVATIVAIIKESGHIGWGIFAVLYSCSLAYLICFLFYNIFK